MLCWINPTYWILQEYTPGLAIPAGPVIQGWMICENGFCSSVFDRLVTILGVNMVLFSIGKHGSSDIRKDVIRDWFCSSVIGRFVTIPGENMVLFHNGRVHLW